MDVADVSGPSQGRKDGASVLAVTPLVVCKAQLEIGPSNELRHPQVLVNLSKDSSFQLIICYDCKAVRWGQTHADRLPSQASLETSPSTCG